jgi:cytochrome c
MRIQVARFTHAAGVAGLVSAALLLGAGAAQAAAAAAGNATAGKTVFDDNCAICHSAERGGPHKVGPNLFGVHGRKSAAATGYTYSAAMMKANITWNNDTLKQYLAAPAKMVPGTKMGFPGFSEPKDEADLIAYLATLK